MDSTAHQWTQEFVVGKSMADHNIGAGGSSACTRLQPPPPPPSVMDQRKILARPQKDHVINCPRCQSTNTKFCYYNNYSLTQPRYFCKTCRRYWTEGGTLRNVPVGGGSRKNKKPGSTSNNSPSSSSMVTVQRIPDLNPPSSISHFSSRNPNKIHDDDQGGHDLNLGYNSNQLLGQQLDYHHHHGSNIPQFLDFPKIEPSSSSSALNFLRNNGITGARVFNSFIPMAPTNTLEGNNALFASSLGFSVEDGNINGNRSYGNHNDHDQTTTTQESINGRLGSLMFTLGSASDKQHSSTNNTDQADHQEKGHHHENANGFWNGMLGGGSW